MKLSIVVPPEVRELEVALGWISKAEQLGFHSAMLGCGEHLDPLIVFALAAARTERVLLTPNIIPTYTRHPLVLAMQAVQLFFFHSLRSLRLCEKLARHASNSPRYVD